MHVVAKVIERSRIGEHVATRRPVSRIEEIVCHRVGGLIYTVSGQMFLVQPLNVVGNVAARFDPIFKDSTIVAKQHQVIETIVFMLRHEGSALGEIPKVVIILDHSKCP